jgi:hypothetical protein
LIDTPQPGDVVYLETELYVSHGADDFRGGKATVATVRPGTSKGAEVLFIEVVENPGSFYNWAYLAAKQEALAAEFGDAWAHPDPDHRPEFNEL